MADLKSCPGIAPPAAASRLAALRVALTETRKSWRWHWSNFSLLRWENSVRRPQWRAEEETKAWHRMREEVGRYATLRAQLRDLDRDRNGR